MPFVNFAETPANCAGTCGPMRTIASRAWHDRHAPDGALLGAARRATSELSGRVGRVESLGSFEDADLTRALRQVLPPALAACTRSTMEWYGCRGAFFHNDAHYDDVLFGVWSVAGPDRELVFPRIDRRLPAGFGSIVVFDPFEPHGVLDAGAARYCGEDYEGADPNFFLGFEVALAPQVRAAFGIGPALERGPMLSSRIAINPETGDFATSAA